jgi:hypothetical protein
MIRKAIVKFTLVYDGALPPNGSPAEKWDIRKYFSPQLEELWGLHPSLKDAARRRFIPRDQPFNISDIHHFEDDKRPFTQLPRAGDIDLCELIDKKGRKFWPLVRETYALKCNLGITFLRKEDAGRVYQGGDLDNRLKTLFDALAVPPVEQFVDDASIADPVYCLLEDDALIIGVNVQTHRLLARPHSNKSDVVLVIDVDVRVVRPRGYNVTFIGD